MSRRVLVLIAAVALVSHASGALRAEEPIRAEDHVVLKSGRVLAGRVTSTEKVHGKAFLVVDTPFGELRIREREVKKRVEQPVDPDATVRIRRLRVVRIEGTVERKPAGGTDWFPVRWKDAYDKPIVNSDNAIIRPGDTIRTGKDGTLDFQPRKDIWIRVGKESLVEIPAVDADKAPSLELRKGKALVDVEGRARGGTFRVRTPITTLSTRDGRFEAGEGGAKVLRGTVEGQAERLSEPEMRRYVYGTPIRRIPTVDMCFVPAGTYPVGGPVRQGILTVHPEAKTGYFIITDPFRLRIERPFLIARRVASRGDFATFLASGVEEGASHEGGPSSASSHRRPMFGVTRGQGKRFAGWAGAQLPSESHWEVAARGPRGLPYPWGRSFDKKHAALHLAGPAGGQSIDDKDAALFEGLRLGRTPILDVSWCGAEGMISGVPEWVSDNLLGGPFGAAMPRQVVRVYGDSFHGGEGIVRGAYGQVSARWPVQDARSGPRWGVTAKSEAVGVRFAVDLGD